MRTLLFAASLALCLSACKKGGEAGDAGGDKKAASDDGGKNGKAAPAKGGADKDKGAKQAAAVGPVQVFAKGKQLPRNTDSVHVGVAGDGTVHLVFTGTGDQGLFHAHGKGDAFEVETIDAGDTGESAAMALDARGKVHVLFDSWSNNELRYATNTGGAWAVSKVKKNNVSDPAHRDIVVGPDGVVHAVTSNPGGPVEYMTLKDGTWSAPQSVDPKRGIQIEVALAPDGKLHAVYGQMKTFTSVDIKHAVLDGGAWTLQDVVTGLDDAKYVSFGLDSKGHVHVVHPEASGGLAYASNAGGKFESKQLVPLEGNKRPMRAQLVVTPDDGVHIALVKQVMFKAETFYLSGKDGTFGALKTVAQDQGHAVALAAGTSGPAYVGMLDKKGNVGVAAVQG